MEKVVIGIVEKPEEDKENLWKKMKIDDELRYLVIKNGAIAIGILPTDFTLDFNDNDIKDEKELSKEEKEDLYQIVDKCDGIILQGGLVSCKYEIEVVKRAIQKDIPIIGICAGFNNLLRAVGGDVILDDKGTHDFYDINYRHEIKIQKDTILYNILNTEKLNVNSIHQMIANREMVEPFAKISSYSTDNLVESFEIPNKRFAIGLKWHPELMLGEESTELIFERYINECKARKIEMK